MRSIFLPKSGITYSESKEFKTFVTAVANGSTAEFVTVISESEQLALEQVAQHGTPLSLLELFPQLFRMEQTQLGIWYPEAYDSGPYQ